MGEEVPARPELRTDIDTIDRVVDGENFFLLRELVYKLVGERDELAGRLDRLRVIILRSVEIPQSVVDECRAVLDRSTPE